jgi:membrane protease YdiL (CAAX protease family)
MYHLESSFTGKNAFWRYLIMLIAIFTATNTIGAIPLLIAMGLKTRVDPDIISILSENPNDLSPLGYDPNLNLLILLFPFIIGLLTFLLLIKPLNSRTLAVTINGTGSFRWRRFIISAFIWVSLSALYMFIVVKFDPSNFSLNNTSATLIPLIVISCLFVPVQASFEEIVFRGYLMQGFTVLLRNRIFPLIMTSLLFALMHSLNPEVGAFGFWTMMPQYILFGLIFGLITILDDGIEAAMGAHTANNAFLLVMNTNKSSALQTDALYEQINIYPWLEFGSLLVMGILTVIILKHIFKWKDFGVLLEKVGPDKDLAHMP